MKIHSIFALAMLFSMTLCADEVNVGWKPNPESENIKKYTLQWGEQSGVYTESLDVAPDSTVVDTNGETLVKGTIDLAIGKTYYIVATATNTSDLTSLPSEELVYAFLRPTQVALPVVIRLNADGTWEIGSWQAP